MRVLSIIIGAILIAGGIFFLFNHGYAFLTIGLLLGIFAIFSGVELLAGYAQSKKSGNSNNWLLAGGIIILLIGLFLIISGQARIITAVIIALSLGFWLIIIGVLRIIASLELKKLTDSLDVEKKSKTWILLLVLGIMLIVLGIFAWTQPLFAAIAIGYLIGFEVLITGINSVVNGVMMKK